MKTKPLTQAQKILIRDTALTDLFNSNQIQQKIPGILHRHHIPMEADIQSDVLMVVFENLMKYNLDKFIEAYQDNPNRILALGVRIALTKGVYVDKRVPKGFNHSIAQQIINQSSLKYSHKIALDGLDGDDETLRLKQIIQADDEGYYTYEQQIENDIIRQEQEQYFIDMWKFIRLNLTEDENQTLQILFQPDLPKMKGKLKKDYMKLLSRMKILITEYQNQDTQ